MQFCPQLSFESPEVEAQIPLELVEEASRSSCSLSPESKKIKKKRGPNKVKGEEKKKLYGIMDQKLSTQTDLGIHKIPPRKLKEFFEEDVKKLKGLEVVDNNFFTSIKRNYKNSRSKPLTWTDRRGDPLILSNEKPIFLSILLETIKEMPYKNFPLLRDWIMPVIIQIHVVAQRKLPKNCFSNTYFKKELKKEEYEQIYRAWSELPTKISAITSDTITRDTIEESFKSGFDPEHEGIQLDFGLMSLHPLNLDASFDYFEDDLDTGACSPSGELNIEK